MKVFSLCLLIAGWFLVMLAIALLRPPFVALFAVGGVGVELLGLGLLMRRHVAARPHAPRGLMAAPERRF